MLALAPRKSRLAVEHGEQSRKRQASGDSDTLEVSAREGLGLQLERRHNRCYSTTSFFPNGPKKLSLLKIRFTEVLFSSGFWCGTADLRLTLALRFLQTLLIAQQDGWFSHSAHSGSQWRQAVAVEPT